MAAACISAPTAQYAHVLDSDDVQYNVQTAPMASDEKIPDSIKHRKLLVIPYSLETKKFVLKTTGTSFRNAISPSQRQIARALSVVWILQQTNNRCFNDQSKRVYVNLEQDQRITLCSRSSQKALTLLSSEI